MQLCQVTVEITKGQGSVSILPPTGMPISLWLAACPGQEHSHCPCGGVAMSVCWAVDYKGQLPECSFRGLGRHPLPPVPFLPLTAWTVA